MAAQVPELVRRVRAQSATESLQTRTTNSAPLLLLLCLLTAKCHPPIRRQDIKRHPTNRLAEHFEDCDELKEAA
jgi:hypothetical protein